MSMLYLFGAPTVLCVLPLLAPGRGTLAFIAIAGLVMLGWAWTEVWAAISHPSAGGFGGAVAFMAMVLASLAFASGLFGRSLGLALQSRGRSRAQVLWTDAVAVAIPVLFLLALQFI